MSSYIITKVQKIKTINTSRTESSKATERKVNRALKDGWILLYVGGIYDQSTGEIMFVMGK